jgi:deoxyribodipyrimidine photo-lyase
MPATMHPPLPGRLPRPPAHDVTAAVGYVTDHLGDLVDDEVVASPRFRGGQLAADAALAALDLTGYAARRNEVWPEGRRGATGLSPYIRHGLLPLPLLWEAVAETPSRDRDRFRDELLWQEYGRHLYARVGPRLRDGLRRGLAGAPLGTRTPEEVWEPTMACLGAATRELVTDGYLVNQTRMWLASHWAVRSGVDWRDGEDVFFRHLLDGSRAANRTGWQWTVGAGTGRAYGFSRFQVEKRSPGLCDTCPLEPSCPIEDWPPDPPLTRTDEPPRLRRDGDRLATAGPELPVVGGAPDLVWLTAESLGDADPALAAHPELPAVFVFDAPLLARLRLSGKRLVFLVETLGDLAERREVHLARGSPVDVLAGRALATTFAPVPGWHRRAATLQIAALHPWPWLRWPHGGSATSFSAWRRALDRSTR